MKRVFMAVDVSNIYYCAQTKHGGKVDYVKLYEYAGGYGSVVMANAYGAQKSHEAEAFIHCIREAGYTPHYKVPKAYTRDGGGTRHKADWDVGICIDTVNAILHRDIDLVILVTADGDLTPLVEWVKARGVEVVIIGANISRDLRRAATEYLEIPKSLIEDHNDATDKAT
jgi:uncharacterized protein (TIGR00288 family)